MKGPVTRFNMLYENAELESAVQCEGNAARIHCCMKQSLHTAGSFMDFYALTVVTLKTSLTPDDDRDFFKLVS